MLIAAENATNHPIKRAPDLPHKISRKLHSLGR
jgi:hypothetical protein